MKDGHPLSSIIYPISILCLSIIYPFAIPSFIYPFSVFSSVLLILVDFAVLRANEPTRVNIKGISGGFEKVFFVENLSFRRIKVTRVSL